jgi:asparagine synthase (glutamine-hydrolysing)
MCGINGIFAYHYGANPIDRGELARTRDHMKKRGPDGRGEWVSSDGHMGLGHRRLSIIDLSEAAAQPMASADGKLVITFNGEIYNYRELRRGLEAKGRVFRSESDTEVLIHLYADKGAAMVHDLRGMFAFALWDEERMQLFLARDPYGIKPLYYADDGWTFRFASQVKALLAGGGLPRDPDPAGLVGFYLFGSVPEPFTTWREIRSVPAGASLTVDRTGASAPARYHSIAAAYRDNEAATSIGPKDRDGIEEVRAALKDSVRSHLIADVPVGAFLSAGIDSGALVGLMRDAGAEDIQTVTIGFEEFCGQHHDEVPIAQEVAVRYGTRHTTRIVTRAEFEADLPRIVEAMDQPSIDGINTWFVSKAAHELGLKVAISGLGGDELFGGYPSFCDIPRWVGALRLPAKITLVGRLVRMLAVHAAGAIGAHPKAAGMLELGGSYAGAYLLRRGLFMPWELGEVLDRDTVRDALRRLRPLGLINQALAPSPRAAFARVATLEASLYMRNQLLRDTDWSSMAHSLEVRVPLVDSTLLGAVAQHTPLLAHGRGKDVLAKAPARPLPSAVTERKKSGFTTPIETWMEQHLQRSQARAQTPSKGGRAAGSRVHRLPWARDWSRVVGRKIEIAA